MAALPSPTPFVSGTSIFNVLSLGAATSTVSGPLAVVEKATRNFELPGPRCFTPLQTPDTLAGFATGGAGTGDTSDFLSTTGAGVGVGGVGAGCGSLDRPRMRKAPSPRAMTTTIPMMTATILPPPPTSVSGSR